MFLTILDKKRSQILPKLGFLEKHGFYLAGGTALALHLGHRTSLNLDFYTENTFDARALREAFDSRFKKVQEIYIAEGTVGLDVQGIGISFFRYPYPRLRPLRRLQGIRVASPEDIAAMKMIAITQRGIKRDFIDIYFLMKKYGLKKIMEFTRKKYPMYNVYIGLQALVYFKDADADVEESRFRLLQDCDWMVVKRTLVQEVNALRQAL